MSKRRRRSNGNRGGKPKTTPQANANKEKVPSTGTDPNSNGEPTGADKSAEHAPEEHKNVDPRSTANDPMWYMYNPQLVLDTCNLPFSRPFGGRIDIFHNFATTHLGGMDPNAKIHGEPGLYSYRVKPSYGENTNIHSSLNVAAQALYTHVRVINSGRKNYDPVDLMLYVMAIADIYSFIVWCQRIYGYAFMYSQRNFYIGKELLISNGMDPDNVIDNLANFNAWINMFISKISAWVIPGDMHIMHRRAFMYGSLYLENDHDNIKDALYQFIPDGFYKFGLDSGSKGCLTYEKIDYNTPFSLDDLKAIGNNLLSNIYGDEDFAIISGDILKAYGDNIVGLAPIPNDFYVIPVYDKYVLTQMHNAVVCNTVRTAANNASYQWLTPDNVVVPYGNIYQSTNGILLSKEGAVVKEDDNGGAKVFLNIYKDPVIDICERQPTPEDVIEATRLIIGVTSYAGQSTEAGYAVRDVYSGSDIITAVVIRKGNWQPDISKVTYTNITLTSNVVNSGAIGDIVLSKWADRKSVV